MGLSGLIHLPYWAEVMVHIFIALFTAFIAFASFCKSIKPAREGWAEIRKWTLQVLAKGLRKIGRHQAAAAIEKKIANLNPNRDPDGSPTRPGGAAISARKRKPVGPARWVPRVIDGGKNTVDQLLRPIYALFTSIYRLFNDIMSRFDSCFGRHCSPIRLKATGDGWAARYAEQFGVRTDKRGDLNGNAGGENLDRLLESVLRNRSRLLMSHNTIGNVGTDQWKSGRGTEAISGSLRRARDIVLADCEIARLLFPPAPAPAPAGAGARFASVVLANTKIFPIALLYMLACLKRATSYRFNGVSLPQFAPTVFSC